MTFPRLVPWAASLIAATTVIALAGCSGGPDEDSKDNMQTAAENQVIQQVHERATGIAQVAGAELKIIGESAAPCEGRKGELSDEIYTVQGSYQLPIPESEHAATLARLRDGWRRQNFTISTDPTTSPGRSARLEAVDPDQYHFFVASTIPPTMLGLRINSPCYKSPS
jgi:hypothetical protein